MIDLETHASLFEAPCLTSDLPGVGGVARSVPEDFVVDELPLYEPTGEGEHLYLWVEKRDISSGHVIDIIAKHFSVNRRSMGYAGRKDRFAVTRQWISLPMKDTGLDSPDDAIGLELSPGEGRFATILDARLHRNKLKTGHLKGNRFRLKLRDVQAPEERAPEIIDRLQRDGVPFVFGPQRFGRDGSTFKMGYTLVTTGSKPSSLAGNKRLTKLAVNAVQSAIFNRIVARRIADNTFSKAILGDVLEKFEGGLFRVKPEEIDEGQTMIDDGVATPTGPLWGPRVLRAEADADALELATLEEFNLSPEAFDDVKRMAPGMRRPFAVRVADLSWSVATDEGTRSLNLDFALPSGAYATVLLREIMKNERFNG